MPTGVELQIQRQIDNLAAWRMAAMQAVATRTSLWSMVDSAANETYENRVKGASVTAVDATLNDVAIGSRINTWFSLHTQYFNVDLSLNGWGGALSTWKWRVSHYFALLYYEAVGSRLSTAYVYPADDLVLGDYVKTSGVFTDGDPVDTLYAAAGKMAARMTNTIGATPLVLTGTFTKTDATTKTVAVTVTALAANDTDFVFGRQLLSGNAAADQPTISVAATAQFTVGQPVLIEDDDGESEYGIVLSIIASTSITLTANLHRAYTTANTAAVTPLFTDATLVTHTGGTNGDTVDIVMIPDRTIALV